MCTATVIVLASIVSGPAALVQASVFLGRPAAYERALEEDLSFEKTLLSEIEGVMGSKHRVFTEKRIESIKHSLEPIFKAVPKNEEGKLGHAAVSYAMYRLFVQRHAWFVVGLEPFKALAEWNSTSPTSVIDQRVPDYITGLFNNRIGQHGFSLHDVAVLAVTIEHLVHKESLLRLSVAYRSLNMSQEDILSIEEGDEVMDTYMAMYILGPLIHNLSTVSERWVRFIRANVTSLYPSFPETQTFVRQVSETIAPERDYLYYSDIAGYVEEVGDRYGRWQDYECRALKDMLLEMEDPSTGGAGRVRLADFYKAALHNGKWQLCESIEYLQKLGALDESNPDNLRVIIPNYVNGPSNCVASSSYYSVCCVNECDEILSHLEHKIAAPQATVKEIATLISNLPSATLPGGRSLSPWLLRRLDEVAEHHGGFVPLHGRLFAQWLHYAYPRECVYPHVVGATTPQTADQFVRTTRRDFAAPKEEMQRVINLPVPHQKRADETGDIEEILELESAMWTMEEELVVWHSPQRVSTKAWSFTTVHPWLRGLAFVLATFSATVALLKSFDPRLTNMLQGTEKHCV